MGRRPAVHRDQEVSFAFFFFFFLFDLLHEERGKGPGLAQGESRMGLAL